jgi:hypothetical protein
MHGFTHKAFFVYFKRMANDAVSRKWSCPVLRQKPKISIQRKRH